MKSTQRPGNMLVEVLVGISVAALVIVSVGNLITSVNQTDKAAANKTQALAYAREGLEITTAIARTEFQCTGAVGTTCTSSGQTCTTLPGYSTCWTPCPLTTGCHATFHPAPSSGTWHLAPEPQTIGTSPQYTRALTIESVGGNSNLKKITAILTWTEGSRQRTVTQVTQLSGWKQ